MYHKKLGLTTFGGVTPRTGNLYMDSKKALVVNLWTEKKNILGGHREMPPGLSGLDTIHRVEISVTLASHLKI